MSKNVRFVLNRSGVRQILESPEMMKVIDQHASRVANAAGDGFEKTTFTRGRATGEVASTTWKAYYQNKKHNTLLKAMKG